MTGALDGITVVSFAQIAQGPLATQMLGDMGAEVIKIEPPGGEWMRNWSMANEEAGGESLTYLSVNRNKRSIELDLKDDEHRDIVEDLLAETDIVVENFRPGVMERLDLSYEDVADINSRIVYCSATGYGRFGPYVKKPGQDLLVQGESGLMSITGHRDTVPTPQGTPVIDFYTGTYLAFAALAALHHRERTGEGQYLDVDLFSSSLFLQSQELTVYANNDEEPVRGREGSGHIYHQAPYGVYETTDGHMTLSLTIPSEVGEILGIESILHIDSWEAAWERRDEINAEIQATLEAEPTDHWLDLLEEHDVWCGRVKSYEEVLDHPQAEANDMFQTIEHPTAGELTLLGIPVRMSETPGSIRRHPPLAGEHTDEVIKEYTSEE